MNGVYIVVRIEKKKPISIASRKQKARVLQQWVCKKISELTGMKWGKDCPIESRPMGQSGVDVRLDKDALLEFPFSVECKFQESWNVHSWVKQARSNKIKGTNWLLIAKRSRGKPVVIMDAEAFFDLLTDISLAYPFINEGDNNE